MILAAAFIHFITIAVSTVCAALGVSIGQGFTSRAAFKAIERQPAAYNEIARTHLLGLALIETGAILGLLISFLLFFLPPTTYAAALAEIGMAIAISIPGLTIGLASAMPAYEAMNAVARQPFLAKK